MENDYSDLKCLFVCIDSYQSESNCIMAIKWVVKQVALFSCAFQVDVSNPRSLTRGTKSYLLIDNSTKVILDGFETKHVTG